MLLTADSQRLKRGLDQGQRHVRGFSNKARGTLSTMGKGFALGIGAASALIAVQTFRKAIGAINREFVEQLKQIDSIAKFSDRLGIATNKLVGLQLQTGLAGSTIEQLNVSLRTMVRNVGDATQGFGQAGRALEMLRIDANKLAQMDAGDQFKVIAERISKLPNQAQKASAAFAIFGRNGVKLLGALQQGAAGVEKARKRAHDLGATLTREEAARVEQLNDAMLELKTGLSGVVRQLVVKMAPGLTAIARKFTDLIAESSGFREQIGKIVTRGMRGFEIFLNFLSMLRRSLRSLQAMINGTAIAMATLVIEADRLNPSDITKGLIDGLRIYRDELRQTNRKIREELDSPLLGERFRNFVDEIKREAKEIGDAWALAGRKVRGGPLLSGAPQQVARQAQAMRDTMEPLKKIRELAMQLARNQDRAGLDNLRRQILAWKDPLGRAELALLAVAGAIQKVNQELGKAALERFRKDARDVFQQTRTPIEQLADEYHRLKNLLDLGLISRETANRALREARQRLLGGERARAETGSLSRTALTAGVVANDPNRDAQRERKKQSETLKKIEQNTRETAARAG